MRVLWAIAEQRRSSKAYLSVVTAVLLLCIINWKNKTTALLIRQKKKILD